MKYKPGTRIKLLFTGHPGTIQDITFDGISGHRYRVRFDDGYEMRVKEEDCAAFNNPIHAYIDKLKAEMLQGGFKYLILGINEEGLLRSVMFASPRQYEAAKASIPGVIWKHYWELKGDQKPRK